MQIHFFLRYTTRFGESLFVQMEDGPLLPLQYLNDEFWEAAVEIDRKKTPILRWAYHFQSATGERISEWEPFRSLDLRQCDETYLQLFDSWNPIGLVENAFFSQPFRLQRKKSAMPPAEKGDFLFRVKAPLLREHEAVCLLGHGTALRNWDTGAPLLLHQDGPWWSLRADLSKERFPLGYKYGVWDTKSKRFLGFEDGPNRTLLGAARQSDKISGAAHDGYLRIPLQQWRGAGVSIPVFSLRSRNSWGIGEFNDLPLLAEWAQSVGMKMIQLLPVNDTSSTHSWTDSYPYAPISVFALHPIYLHVAEVAGKKHASVLKPYLSKQKSLNALKEIDYEAVLQMKWEIIRQLYEMQKAEWAADGNWKTFYKENKHWLDPYAVFCWLRDANGSCDFSTWPQYASCRPDDIEKLTAPDSKHFDQIGLHLFVQWHLHRQLQAAVDDAHARGLALKGDLPIGIYRHSVDAWMAPELYNMDMQAGAPPDPFAEKGQNWGFPTYDWVRMKADGYAWWRQRFEQMSHYFDAFRIDHILGFFRIWSIPMHAVEGILGHFSPAIPIRESELRQQGIGFSYERLCKPFITDAVLQEYCGAAADWVLEHCLQAVSDNRYELLSQFDTQRKVESYFAAQPPGLEQTQRQQGLYNLIANVILLDVPGMKGAEWHGAFRFDMEKTASFRYLPEQVKGSLKSLYIDYFYHRQDGFWEREAMEKLPALKRSTNMLICGEDLGLVPACVPGVMKNLGLLSLEIQRMPKAPGAAFLSLREAPYLSVVTPGTHDMDVLRGWWEEDRERTQRYFNEVLGHEGTAPYFCESWVMREIIIHHFQSPAMWAIFQWQDLLGMDETLRRENPQDERINIPANPKHYWRYRSHISLEDMLKASEFNRNLKQMVEGSGRA